MSENENGDCSAPDGEATFSGWYWWLARSTDVGYRPH
jgi:hypothetical protein